MLKAMRREIRAFSILLLSVLILLPSTFLISAKQIYASSIALSIDQGRTGTPVIVTGEGFTGKIATIKWDGVIIAEKIPISETGILSYELSVPRLPKGVYTIEVTDDSHWSGSIAAATFNIIPKIEVLPRVGRPSSQISVVGTGFPARESGITITWDGTTIKESPVTADLKGTWSITLLVPQTTKGEHRIGASGSITTATDIGDIVFIVGPAAKIRPLSGPVGTEITVEGFGFRVGEDGITIAFDGEIIVCNIVGSSDGSWQSTARIPPSIKGKHRITVYGSSFTPIGTVPDFDFEVIPSLYLEPSAGKTGNKVNVSGTGFSENESINLTFDNTSLDTEILTSNLGSFSTTFLVPQLKEKEHTVIASGSMGNSAKSIFTANKPPPATPKLESPAPNASIMIFNSFVDVISNTLMYAARLFKRSDNDVYPYPHPKAVFIWSQSTNSDDNNYTLQIASQSDFAKTTLIRNNISNPRYVMSQYDELPPGTYYWRVKALDSIGNKSSWSDVLNFRVITMPTSVLILSIAIPALFTAILLAPILITWRSRRNRL